MSYRQGRLSPYHRIRLSNYSVRARPLVERVAYKVWSEVLQAYLWIVEADQDMASLRSRGVKESIYTYHEIKELKKLSKEDLKEVHKVKEVFEDSRVEKISRKESNADR